MFHRFRTNGSRYRGNSSKNGALVPTGTNRFTKDDAPNATTNPKAYKANNTKARASNGPNATLGITSAIKTVYTGSRAEQVMKGVTKMVNNRSRGFSMLRAAMMAGMAHALALTMGTTLLPLNPKGRSTRSSMNTTRAMYPLSSNKAMKKKSSAICGKNIKTPETPGTMPLATSSVNAPAGKTDSAQAPN